MVYIPPGKKELGKSGDRYACRGIWSTHVAFLGAYVGDAYLHRQPAPALYCSLHETDGDTGEEEGGDDGFGDSRQGLESAWYEAAIALLIVSSPGPVPN